MLNFVEPRVAINYFLLVLVSFIGMLQIVAVRYRLKSIMLFPARLRPCLGIFAGLAIIMGAFIWFAAATPEMLQPGPAGFEISLLLLLASLTALLVCRLFAVWIQE